MSKINIMLSWIKQEQGFITSRPEHDCGCSLFLFLYIMWRVCIHFLSSKFNTLSLFKIQYTFSLQNSIHFLSSKFKTLFLFKIQYTFSLQNSRHFFYSKFNTLSLFKIQYTLYLKFNTLSLFKIQYTFSLQNSIHFLSSKFNALSLFKIHYTFSSKFKITVTIFSHVMSNWHRWELLVNTSLNYRHTNNLKNNSSA